MNCSCKFIVPTHLVNMGAQLMRVHKLWDSQGNIHPWLVVRWKLFLWMCNGSIMCVMKRCSSLWQKKMKYNSYTVVNEQMMEKSEMFFYSEFLACEPKIYFIDFMLLCCYMYSDLGFGERLKQNVIFLCVGIKFNTQNKHEQCQISTSLSHLISINTTSPECTVF